jgi:ketosteroid isomerase-like protein
MTVANLDDFKALDPFFRAIETGLDGLVDGGHFFELFADDAVTEYVVTVPGYPRKVEGRDGLAELYRHYGDTIVLESFSDLRVHHDREASVVVLEYAVHGRLVANGRPYGNRFVSVITIKDRKVTHWRDYLDSYAVIQALG